MPFDCLHRQRFGADICLADCPATYAQGGCLYARVDRDGDLPAADPAIIDVAILDMHHGWPNLGHAAIVHSIQNAVCDLQPVLQEAGLSFRVISFDVRRGQQVPEPPGGRIALYIGTGGPGHLDPARNDGTSPGSQGIREDPSWEPRVFALFDAIRADRDAALLAVCHTFGVMCRWLGVADAVLRTNAQGGKSAGVLENILTPQAADHPWFGRFARELADRRRFRILDNRLYDLIPTTAGWSGGVTPLSYDTHGIGGPRGDAVTMIEVTRNQTGTMPRMLGVNHHPEIVNRPRQLADLRRRMDLGEVSPEWYAERSAALTQDIDDHGDQSLRLTSSYTFLAPLRFYLHREAERRARALGHAISIDDRRLPFLFHPLPDQLQPDDQG
jgi:hypothetical protein